MWTVPFYHRIEQMFYYSYVHLSITSTVEFAPARDTFGCQAIWKQPINDA